MRKIEVEGLREAKAFLHKLAIERRWTPAIADLEYSERDYLENVVPKLRRLARESGKIPFARAPKLSSFATTLALLRGEAAERNQGRWRLDQDRFRGNPKHLDLLLRALGAPNVINEWNAWRSSYPGVRPDLRGVNLRGLNLQGVSLHRARLDGASLSLASSRASDFHLTSFSKAKLGGVDFSHTDLKGADMRQAILQDAILADADLSGADMREAILTGCVLNRATLHGTKLSGALIWGTSVWDVQYGSRQNQKNKDQKGMLIGWDNLDPMWP